MAAILNNADVLEVIAEYACATVADACALRTATRAWRRAVDTIVRAHVFASQPALTDPHPQQPALRVPLRLHEDGQYLDPVRIAFTCDRFKSIARLVVVAFALDGAKDELREGGVCGPRPVDCSAHDPADRDPSVDPTRRFHGVVTDFRARGAVPPVAAHLHRCCTSFVASKDTLTEGLCEAATAHGALRSVTRLYVAIAGTRRGLAPELAARFISALGGQLTHLHLSGYVKALGPAIKRCTALERIAIPGIPLLDDVAESLCGALIASGAPLRSVNLFLLGTVGGEQGVRLLEAVPTIVDASMLAVQLVALSAAVRSRLHSFDDVGTLPLSRRLDVTYPEQPWTPSARVETLVVPYTDEVVPLRVVDFATAFPNLRQLELDDVCTWDPALNAADLRLPSSLEKLRLDGSVAFDFGFLSQLGRHAQTLSALTDIAIERPVGPVAKRFDITPLAALAETLRTLYLGPWKSDAGVVDVTPIESTLSRLVGLEVIHAPGLPTARCFMRGEHRSLRTICVNSVDNHEQSAGAPFRRLVEACPRLVRATPVGGIRSVIEVPGWTIYNGSACRCSFAAAF